MRGKRSSGEPPEGPYQSVLSNALSFQPDSSRTISSYQSLSTPTPAQRIPFTVSLYQKSVLSNLTFKEGFIPARKHSQRQYHWKPKGELGDF